MNVLILAYFLETYGTRKLASHLRARGHRTILASPLDCTLAIRPEGGSLTHQGEPLPPIDVVFPRSLAHYENGIPAPRVLESSLATFLRGRGALCFNAPEAKAVASNKLAAAIRLASAGIPAPVTIAAWSPEAFEEALAEIGTPLILKVLSGTRGAGVLRCDTAAGARSAFDTLRLQGQPFLIQQYIGDEGARHVRVLVVGGRVLGGHRSIPRPGDFRANLAQGASVEPHVLSAECERVALAASACIGLDIAGVDILESSQGPQVIEVNSVPGLEVIDQICGIDSAAAIADLLEERARAS
jgi:ribosomal protein S6--L-glutamate ligase